MAKIYDDQKGPKDEWAKLKKEPLKVKLQWLFQYYGLTAAVVLISIGILVSIAVTIIINRMPRVVVGEFFSEPADVSVNESVKEELCAKLGYEPNKYRIDISTMTGAFASEDAPLQTQRLIARVNALDIDFVVANEKLFKDYTDPNDPVNCLFYDLRELLPKETLKALDAAGRLVYIETNEGPVPFYIDINGTRFYELYKLTSGQAFFGVIFNAPDLPGVIALIENYFL